MPIAYHLASSNIRSFWKHLIFTAAFTSPIAAQLINKWYTKIKNWAQQKYYLTNLIQLGFTLTIILIISCSWISFSAHWRFQRSWPSATKILEYLEINRLPSDNIFAEASAVYKYHLFSGFEDPFAWTSTWYIEYEELQGTKAMEKAIQDQAFDYIILNNYYTNEVNKQITPTINKYYNLVLTDKYKVSGVFDNYTYLWESK